MLITENIHRLRDVTVLEPVAVLSRTTTSWGQCEEKRHWAIKCPPRPGLVAESLCYLLARLVDAPVPMGAVVCSGPQPYAWASERLRGAVSWEPSHANYLVNIERVGTIAALDATLGNEDRHEDNFLVTPAGGSEEQLVAWAIDFDDAWVGDINSLRDHMHDVPSVTSSCLQCLPIGQLRPSALAAAEALRALDERPLREYVREACLLAGETDNAKLASLVRTRLSFAQRLTEEFLRRLEAAQQ